MINTPIILLIGGRGTRLASPSQKNATLPKSLQKINSKYLLFHAMQNFIDHGFNNFIFPLGNFKKTYLDFFKSIKKINNKSINVYKLKKEFLLKIKVTKSKELNLFIMNTKINANKAERILKCVEYLELNNFGVSYGDGVGDINLTKLYNRHINSKCIMSVAAKKPVSQYGIFKFQDHSNVVSDFIEKPTTDYWANIGYFFLKKEAVKFLKKYKKYDLEMGVLRKIAKSNLLNVYKHKGFWKSVDTQKDVKELSQLIKHNEKK